MKVTGHPISPNVFFSSFLMPMLSGVLLGLSFPTWPSVHLEPLAWVALVPLLLSLEREERFAPFFRQVWVTMFLFCLITLWWVGLATLSGGILTIFAQSLFSSIPLLAFYYVRRFVGFRFALLMLPFLWTGWEWAYMQQDLSLGWLTLGNSQANLLWMVQYADVTGVWGVSFWVLVFNVATVVLIRGHEPLPVRLGIVLILVFMVASPLFYARKVFVDQPSNPGFSTVRVAMVQPNIDPHEKWGGLGAEETMARLYRLTNQALQGDSRPDLLIWPETAIPFYIRDPLNKASMDSVRRMIESWNTPLLTGFPDEQPMVMPLAGEEGGVSGDDTLRNAPRIIYNASMLLMPGSSRVQVYRKMRLVPFGERV
ncbi:MAG: apolipoprotein N-acyltransferase, partial [Chlorobiaceae bacterium]|nr:apolipoprotein N-acyltransferase [Chlorobiaceae bacterium]